ncbi:MAG: FAD-dependent oxidoreductase [Tepidiformaceae bacterium]
MRVTVVGAGISGLTSALVLQEAGHDVRVIAAEKGVATTSGAAGAIWYPFRAEPAHLVNRWAKRTHEYLSKLAANTPAAGVDMLTVYETVEGSDMPSWAECVTGLELVTTGLPFRAAAAWRFRAPRVEAAIHLPWLESRLHEAVQLERVESLDALPGDAVVNCSGLGARTLAHDSELVAILGQTVIVDGGTMPMDAAITDERNPQALFYTIPRRNEVVLGGCATDCPDDAVIEPSPSLREEILARCRAAGFEPGSVLRERCGLRPGRSTVRLEREGRIVHNYGHGGAGYTLARGCAEDVAALLAG